MTCDDRRNSPFCFRVVADMRQNGAVSVLKVLKSGDEKVLPPPLFVAEMIDKYTVLC